MYKPWRTKDFVQFDIIMHVSVSVFRFHRIPMLWVYGHYKCFNSFSAGTVFIRQNLTSTDVRFWCIKSVPALKRLVIVQSRKGNLIGRGYLIWLNTGHCCNRHTCHETGSMLGQRGGHWANIEQISVNAL